MRDYPKLGLYDTPVTLTGTEVTFAPKWDAIEDVHELRSGITRKYLIGYRFKAVLAVKFMPSTTSELLRTAYAGGSQLYFWPYPDTYPGSFYKVMWMNGWELSPAQSLTGKGVSGQIDLRGMDVSPWPSMWKT
jgi:hypothetical protein